jgi:hypothetical protein
VIKAITAAVAEAQSINDKVINIAKRQLTSDILSLHQSQSQFESLPLVFSYTELVTICENISNIAPGFSEIIEQYISETSKIAPLDRTGLNRDILIAHGALEAYSDVILGKMEAALLRGGKRNRYIKKTRNTKKAKKINRNKKNITLHKSKRNTKKLPCLRKTRKITKRPKYIKKHVTKHRR